MQLVEALRLKQNQIFATVTYNKIFHISYDDLLFVIRLVRYRYLCMLNPEMIFFAIL